MTKWKKGKRAVKTKDKVCFRCKAANLTWGKDGDKWRLMEQDGTAHECPPGTPERAASENGKICNRCGKPGLAWKETGHGWRLTEKDGALHDCG